MFCKKPIAALAALIFFVGASMAIGKGVDSVIRYDINSDNPIFDLEELSSILLAQNDKSTSQESEESKSESATGESDAAADDDKKSSETESKPLKPFVPSEQIPGEQAVDFPADI